jgi:tetratricopeptide (TPR) repeat protein
MMYKSAGFFEKSEYYIQEKLKLNRDSADYYAYLSWFEFDRGNWDKVIEMCNKRLAIDSTDMEALGLIGAAYLLLKEYEESLTYFEKLIDGMNASGDTIYPLMKWISYAYRKKGDLELADYYIKQELKYWNRSIEQRRNPEFAFHRAAVYAFRGMQEETLADLREFSNSEVIHHKYLSYMKNWPFFDNIRDDPGFQKILNNVEAKCQIQHEKVRKWLEENNML